MKKLFTAMLCMILLIANSNSNAQTFTNYHTTDGLPDNFICGGVAVDSNNNVWVGTVAGVAKYNNNTWTVYTTTNGLIDNYTTCIAVDKNNNVWVGTNSGVSKFNGTTWTSYTTTNGLIDNGVAYIAGDIDGSVWFATTAGLSRLKDSIWTNYTTANGLPNDVINYIAMEPSGNKWLATQMGGLSRYNNTIFTNYSTSTVDSLLDNNIFAIAVDKLGQKWIGTWYGITKLDNVNNWVKNYRQIDGMYNNFVRDIKVDANSNVWVGMFADYNMDGGISKFDGTTWISYSVAQGLADKQVIRLAVDKNNDIWIATGNGVSKLNHTSAIDKTENNATIIAYPNPAKDFLILNVQKSTQFKIMDISGKIVINSNVDGTTKLDISSLQQGMYLIWLQDDDKISTRKFMKN
jgi:ligand-binding sensor domain-containing protein